MRNSHIFYGVLFCLVVIFSSVKGFCEDTKNPFLMQKTLNRWVDPVIMDGGLVSEMTGLPIANMRLYVHKNGSFDPIRYQIDEMTEENGDWILPEGPIPNGELGNGEFNTWDMLIFMADDTGDKAAKEVWTSGYTKGIEIEVIDPLTKEKGWCYLLYFTSNPPARSSLPDYTTFDFEANTETSDYRQVEDIITEDGFRTTYYKSFSIPKQAGGNDKSFVDRLKIRVTVKMFFNTVTLKFSEENLKSRVLAYKRGPVRVIKRVEQYALLPGGIKVLRAVSDILQCRATATCPIIWQIPFRLDKVVSSLVMRFGTDYNKNVIGARVVNSSNPQGFLVDGKMDDDELNNFNPVFDKWRLITGDCGTFMTRTIPTQEILKHVKMSMGLIDDITQVYPPESDPGTIGYLYQDWDIGKAPKGTYYMFLDFYWVPNYKPGDEFKYTNYMDHPLKIQVGDQERTSQVLHYTTNLCKRYK